MQLTKINEINVKIVKLNNDVNGEICKLESRVKILESDNIKKDEAISTLKFMVVNMQKCLNHIDGQGRKLNVIGYE